MQKNLRNNIIEIAHSLVGTQSKKYALNSPEMGCLPEDGFDCSGFIAYVLREAGVVVPDYIGADYLQRPLRHTNEFWDHYGVTVHDEAVRPGDLVFFSRTGEFPTHVGIVSGSNEYIHAPGKDGTTVELKALNPSPIPHQADARILYTKNPIGFKSPVAPIANPDYRYHQQVLE